MKYFKAYELVDRKTYEKMGEDALSLFNPTALIMLDDFREFIEAPVTVNNWYFGGRHEWRGWRTKAKCIELGAPGSEHGKGNAFDLNVKDFTANEVRQIVRINQADPLLRLIMRMEDKVGWIHMDRKPVKNRIYFFKP